MAARRALALGFNFIAACFGKRASEDQSKDKLLDRLLQEERSYVREQKGTDSSQNAVYQRAIYRRPARGVPESFQWSG